VRTLGLGPGKGKKGDTVVKLVDGKHGGIVAFSRGATIKASYHVLLIAHHLGCIVD
jgi:hypothetical protein